MWPQKWEQNRCQGCESKQWRSLNYTSLKLLVFSGPAQLDSMPFPYLSGLALNLCTCEFEKLIVHPVHDSWLLLSQYRMILCFRKHASQKSRDLCSWSSCSFLEISHSAFIHHRAQVFRSIEANSLALGQLVWHPFWATKARGEYYNFVWSSIQHPSSGKQSSHSFILHGVNSFWHPCFPSF